LEDIQILFEREFGKIKWSKVWSDFIKKHKTPQIIKWKLWFSGKEIELDDEERNSLFDLANRSIDSMIMSTAYEKESLLGQLLESLQSRYSFKNFPYSVECIDISHLGWEFTAGAVVSMVNGIINKKWYRKYKLTDVNGDDYKAMEELLVRKLYHLDTEKASLPDLIILDGWKWQLWIIKTLITQSKKFAEISNYIQFASLWKWKARWSKWKNAGFNEKLYVLSHDLEITEHDIKYDEADRLLTKLRDEAHRFSNAYRTKMDSMRFRE
jgi:excinuclease ABC subunit C